MGMYAQYLMVSDETLTKMKTLNNKDLMIKIDELTNGDSEIYDIDKLWDGLHFLLTGASASKPIESNPLSEAITGVRTFLNDENADFISYICINELSIISSVLKTVDIEKLKNDFDPQKFHQANIYPDIWQYEEEDDLLEELLDHFDGLKEFYAQAAHEKKNIIVGIF